MNSPPILSVDHAYRKAADLCDKGKFSEAKTIFQSLLVDLPDELPARRGLKACARHETLGERQSFITRVLSSIRERPPFVVDAMIGWRYTHLIDDQFIDSSLTPIPIPGELQLCPAPPINNLRTPGDLLDELVAEKGSASIYSRLRSVTTLDDHSVLADSFVHTHDSDLPDALSAVFQQEQLNILVIGAGCTGLAIANSLRLSLGERVNILVAERRVFRDHFKQHYSRSWLTFIATSVLAGFIDDRILSVLESVGERGLMGVPINVFETLLLLSSKDIGVKFHFSKNSDYAYAADADLVFDATGGRLVVRDDSSARLQYGPSFSGSDIARFGEGYRAFGITKVLSAPQYEVSTKWLGERMLPLHHSEITKVAYFKITNIPISLHKTLLTLVAQDNEDGRFYVWPGGLRHEFNEILVLVSLHKSEYEWLSNCIGHPVRVSELLANKECPQRIDNRLVKVLFFLTQQAPQSTVEHPFLYEPYVRPYPDPFDTFHGTPQVPIGDSVFNGNPKTGNGLGRHLRDVKRIHDCFLNALQPNRL